MRVTTFRSVDEYMAAQSEPVRATLEMVRNAIRRALPDAEETIAYNVPTYALEGSSVLHFAAWKQHYSIYGATNPLIAKFRDELAPYKIDRGTIRFPFSQRVPVKLIASLAKFRASEIRACGKAGSQTPGRR